MDTQPQMLPQNDHDLLIVVHTNQMHMASDLKAIKEDLSPRLSVIESTKADRSELSAALATFKSDLDKAVSEVKRDFGDAIKPLLDGDKDHEDRIRRIERYSWLAIGGLIVAQIVIQAAFSSNLF